VAPALPYAPPRHAPNIEEEEIHVKSIVQSIAIAASLFAGVAHADITVTDAWVRATVAQQTATGAFMRISTTEDTTLVAASSPATPLVEVHEMTMKGGVMRMRKVDAVAVPAGETVELKPGGFHVMLLDLKQPVNEGDTVALKLVFRDSKGRMDVREVKAEVRALNAAAGAPAHGEHHH
jgi:periplasmic copper chaperone A